MLVLVAVSSINTNRVGSSIPCSRTQRRRARATSGHPCSAARRLFLTVTFFLTVTLWRSKNRQTAVRLPGIRCLRIAATISSRVRSGCPPTRANSHSACFANGEVLPPLGFALALPVSRQRCNHFIAELALRLKLSAASRRDAPASTASITRSRKSSEYGLGIGLAPQTPNRDGPVTIAIHQSKNDAHNEGAHHTSMPHHAATHHTSVSHHPPTHHAATHHTPMPARAILISGLLLRLLLVWLHRTAGTLLGTRGHSATHQNICRR